MIFEATLSFTLGETRNGFTLWENCNLMLLLTPLCRHAFAMLRSETVALTSSYKSKYTSYINSSDGLIVGSFITYVHTYILRPYQIKLLLDKKVRRQEKKKMLLRNDSILTL